MHIMQILRLQLVATMVTISRESKYIIRIATNVNIVFACVRIDMNLKPSFRFTPITGITLHKKGVIIY